MSGSTRVMKVDSVKRWVAWARALAVRSRLIRGRRGALSAKFLLRPRMQTAAREQWRIIAPVNYESHLHLAFHPMASLTAVARFQGAGRPATRDISSTVVRYSEPGHTETLRQTSRVTVREAALFATARRTEELVQRVTERTRRIEERVFPRAAVLARTSRAEAQKDATIPAAASPEWWRDPASAAGRQHIAAPDVNVEQIADTVMRRLDQRVNAWRERTGRV